MCVRVKIYFVWNQIESLESLHSQADSLLSEPQGNCNIIEVEAKQSNCDGSTLILDLKCKVVHKTYSD